VVLFPFSAPDADATAVAAVLVVALDEDEMPTGEDEDEDEDEEPGAVPEEVPADEAVVVPIALLLPPEGAGVAEDGSVSAPIPQGIDCPSGCVVLGAATVLPLASAMAKRVVQVLFGEDGSEN